MRTFFQLAFTLIIAISIVSCGGETKSSDSTSKGSIKNASTDKPAPTFKMKNDKKNQDIILIYTEY